jgi:hypothetical protein
MRLVMASILQEIKDQYVDKCICSETRTRCKINLQGLNCVVLKGENLVQNSKKICDCFIFDDRETLTIHLVELKSTTSHASDIEEKFKNSLANCNRILKNIAPNRQYVPKLVIAAHTYRHAEAKILRNILIKFNNKTLRLNLKNCGLKLSSI